MKRSKLAQRIADELGYIGGGHRPGPGSKHPLHSLFKDAGIPQALVAKAIGYAPNYVHLVLAGKAPTSPAFEAALNAFAAKVSRTAAELAKADA